MSLPVRHLPVLQHWDCHACGNCCYEFEVSVTEDERQRISGQGWEKDPDFAGLPLFVRSGPWWRRRYRLNHRRDGACIFLSPQGRCRIHEKFGADAKPLACRLYPFLLVPAGGHWRVGLRFGCPSAAANRGKPMAEHQRGLERYAAELERQVNRDLSGLPPSRLRTGQRVDWPDFFRFVQGLLAILRNRQDRFERRMRKCLALANLCRQARFGEVTGGRLVEFLNLLGSGLDAEVPADPNSLPPPSWIGRVLFRQAAALYLRKDHGRDRGLAQRGRGALLRAAWRFIRGNGPVPQLHGRLPPTTFERGEEPAGPLPEAAELVLERYYAVKVESLQFCGPTNFGLSFWEGVESLALGLAVILWLIRILGDLPREEAATLAVSIVDNNFGFNRSLGSLRQRLGLSILARRGELEKLIAWYSR